jgi:hypothetical protein
MSNPPSLPVPRQPMAHLEPQPKDPPWTPHPLKPACPPYPPRTRHVSSLARGPGSSLPVAALAQSGPAAPSPVPPRPTEPHPHADTAYRSRTRAVRSREPHGRGPCCRVAVWGHAAARGCCAAAEPHRHTMLLHCSRPAQAHTAPPLQPAQAAPPCRSLRPCSPGRSPMLPILPCPLTNRAVFPPHHPTAPHQAAYQQAQAPLPCAFASIFPSAQPASPPSHHARPRHGAGWPAWLTPSLGHSRTPHCPSPPHSPHHPPSPPSFPPHPHRSSPAPPPPTPPTIRCSLSRPPPRTTPPAPPPKAPSAPPARAAPAAPAPPAHPTGQALIVSRSPPCHTASLPPLPHPPPNASIHTRSHSAQPCASPSSEPPLPLPLPLPLMPLLPLLSPLPLRPRHATSAPTRRCQPKDL